MKISEEELEIWTGEHWVINQAYQSYVDLHFVQ